MHSLDLELFKKLEILIGDLLEKQAEQILNGKSTDWPDHKYRLGVIKGLREALSLAKDANDELIGLKREER